LPVAPAEGVIWRRRLECIINVGHNCEPEGRLAFCVELNAAVAPGAGQTFACRCCVIWLARRQKPTRLKALNTTIALSQLVRPTNSRREWFCRPSPEPDENMTVHHNTMICTAKGSAITLSLFEIRRIEFAQFAHAGFPILAEETPNSGLPHCCHGAYGRIEPAPRKAPKVRQVPNRNADALTATSRLFATLLPP